MKLARLALQVAGAAGLLVPACGGEGVATPTELVVAVHADPELAARLTRLRASVYPADAVATGAPPSAQLSFELTPAGVEPAGGAEFALPLSFAIVKKRARTILLRVEAFERGQPEAVVEQALRASFPERALGLVRVHLSSACVGSACSPLASTCDAAAGGSCVDVASAEVTHYPDAAALAGDELAPPDDPAGALRCDTPGARDCGGPDGAPRECTSGLWASAPACEEGAACEPDGGACVKAAVPCRDGCDAGCGDGGACVVDPCEDASVCAPGECEAEGEAYRCSCPSEQGYRPRADGAACEDVPECETPERTVCRGQGGRLGASFEFDYACEELTPFYRCTGQLAEHAWRALGKNERFEPRTYSDGALAARYDPESPDDVVFDRLTGLEWQQKLTHEDDLGWEAAVGHCGTVRAAGGGFRAPSYVELLGLVDDTGSSRALASEGGGPVAYDEQLFPGPHDAWYWARDARGADMDTAYLVTQIGGEGGRFGEKRGDRERPGSTPYLMRVRCVRRAPAGADQGGGP